MLIIVFVDKYYGAQRSVSQSVSESVSQPADYGFTTAVRFPAEKGLFLFANMFVPVSGTTKLPIQWLLQTLSSGLKLTDHEAEH